MAYIFHCLGKTRAEAYASFGLCRQVYVNKNGQELTGQIAYRHYKRVNLNPFQCSCWLFWVLCVTYRLFWPLTQDKGGLSKGKRKSSSKKKKNWQILATDHSYKHYRFLWLYVVCVMVSLLVSMSGCFYLQSFCMKIILNDRSRKENIERWFFEV